MKVRVKAMASLVLAFAFFGSSLAYSQISSDAVYRPNEQETPSKPSVAKRNRNRLKSSKKVREVQMQQESEKPKEKLCTILVPTDAGLIKKEISCDQVENI